MNDNILELDKKQVKTLLKKAYEWLGKINKRHNRNNYFRTNRAIDRFKAFLNRDTSDKFVPNKTEILIVFTWFLRCPAKGGDEKDVFMYVGIIYNLHKAKLKNTKKT